MIGLALALAYLAGLLVTGTVFEASYYYATLFLFRWYFLWGAICSAFAILLVALMGLVTASVREGIRKKINGKLMALAAGTAFSISWLYLFHRLCFIAGAYFLHTALVVRGDEYAYFWNFSKLSLGVILWIAGWIIHKFKN